MKSKRILACLLAAVLISSVSALPASAEVLQDYPSVGFITDTGEPGDTPLIAMPAITLYEDMVLEGNVNAAGKIDLNGYKLTIEGDFNSWNTVNIDGGELIVKGNYNHYNGTLTLSGGKLTVYGDYRMQEVYTDTYGNTSYGNSDGVLKMTNDDDYFLVCGNFYFQSVHNLWTNELTAGTLELKGNFNQLTGSAADNFNCRGTHKVIFSGEGNQKMNFADPTYSGFNILAATPNTNVDVVGRIRTIGDNCQIRNFTQYDSLDVNGQTLTLSGYMRQHGDIYVNEGTLDVKSYYMHQDGNLRFNGGSVLVGGNYRLQDTYKDDNGATVYGNSNGCLRMTTDDDYFLVKGNFYTQSVHNLWTNELTAGTLELKGNFSQLTGSATDNFNCRGTHKVIFSGTRNQKITFADPWSSGFNELAGTVNTDIDYKGRITTLGCDAEFKSFEQYGDFDLNENTLTVTGDLTEYSGKIVVNNGLLDVKGNYQHTDGDLRLTGGSVKVGGDYRLQGIEENEEGQLVYGNSSGNIRMTNENDYFLVNGDFYTQSVHNLWTNELTEGTLELKGNFTQLVGNATDNFNSRDNHKIILSGAGHQEIFFEAPTSSGFNILSKVTGTDVNITGRINKLGASATISNFIQYGSLDMNGKRLGIKGNITEYGNINVNKGSLIVIKNYLHQDGKLTVGGGTVKVSKDYRLQSLSLDENEQPVYGKCNGSLNMTDANDKFVVSGNFYTQSVHNLWTNELTAGTLELKGNFTQIVGSASDNFNSRNEHKVVLSGTKHQDVIFETPGNSGFNIYENTANADVDMVARINKLGNNSFVNNFDQYSDFDLSGSRLIVKGDLTQHGNITVNKGELAVEGNVLAPSGRLTLSGGTVDILGDYRLQDIGTDEDGNSVYTASQAALNMTDENDYLTVHGDFVTQSVHNLWTNELYAGTMELKGNFTQIVADATDNFNSRGNHKMIFSGEGHQDIIFNAPRSSGINILYATPNTDVDIVGRINTIGNNTEIKNFEQYNPLDVNGKSFTVSGDLIENGKIEVNGGTFTVKGNTLHQDGTLYVTNGTVAMLGDYILQAPYTNDDGETVLGKSDGALNMTNDDGYMLVGGDFVTQSKHNLWTNELYAGTLELKGNFTQLYGGASDNFNSRDNHKVVFSGDGKQTVYFENPTSSGIAVLAGTVNTDVDITGRISRIGADTAVNNFVQYGDLDVNGKMFTVKGGLEENGSINVNKGTLSVNGDYIHQGGTLRLGAGKIKAYGDYKLQTKTVDDEGEIIYGPSDGCLKMTDRKDYFFVGGNFVTQSKHNLWSNELTDGMLELKGNFTQLYGGASDNFRAMGMHVVYFSSDEPQNVTFANPRSSFFNIVYVKNMTNSDHMYYYVSENQVYFNRIANEENMINLSSISKDRIVIGDTLEIDMSAIGGTGLYTYAVYYKKSYSSSWMTKQDFSINNNVTIKPLAATSYDIRIEAMDSEGRVDSVTYTVKVENTLKNKSEISANEAELGNKIRITAAAEDGIDPYTYAAYYRKSGESEYTVLRDFATGTNIDFAPTEPGKYELRVDVKDSSEDETVVSKTFAVEIKATELVNRSTVSAETIQLGESVDLKGIGFGGTAPYTYAFFCKKSTDSGYTTLQNFNANDEVTLTPDADGDYSIVIKVKDSDGKVIRNEYSLTVASGELLNKSELSSDTVVLGDTVTLTGVAEGGTSPYKYAFFYKKSTDSKYTTLQNFDSINTVTFAPDAVGEYSIVIKVKDNTGKSVRNEYSLAVTDNELTNNSSMSAETIGLGESVTLNGSATGGTAPYQYAFYYKKSTDRSYSTIRGFKTDSAAEFTPASSGSYSVVIKVKDSTGKVARNEYTLTVNEKALANNSTLSSETIGLGESVKLTGAADGGTAPYTYAFFYKKSTDRSYTTLRNFAANNTYDLAPNEAGSYNVVIKVRDSKGTIVRNEYSFTVEESAELSNTSTVSASSVVLGQSVELTGSAIGGTAPYTYAFYYKKSTDKGYTTLQGFKTNSTCNFAPEEEGTYSVVIKVKDSTGAVARNEYSITVDSAELKNKSTLSETAIGLGESVTVTGAASGGTAPYTYAFFYKKSTDSSYKTIQNFSAADNCTITPDEEGSYIVVAKIKDSTGASVRKEMTFEVR